MSRARPTRLSLLALVALSWLCAARGTAQDDTASYDAWIDQAMDGVSRGDLPRAYAAFEHAYQVDPSARALRGMGVISYRMGQFARAKVELEAALSERARPLTAALRSSVSSVLESLQSLVGYCEPTGAPVGAKVSIDGAPASIDASGRIVATAGPHELVIEAEGHERYVTTLRIVADEVTRVSAVLAPSPAASEPQSTEIAPLPLPSPAITQPAPEAPASRSPGPAAPRLHVQSVSPRDRTFPWVAAAGVPVFLAGAGVFWAQADRIGDGLVERCTRDDCTPAERRERIARSSLTTFETLTNVSLGLAALSALAAVSLFVLEGDDGTELGVTSHGVVARRSF